MRAFENHTAIFVFVLCCVLRVERPNTDGILSRVIFEFVECRGPDPGIWVVESESFVVSFFQRGTSRSLTWHTSISRVIKFVAMFVKKSRWVM